MKNYRSLCLSIALMLSSLGLVAQEAIDDPGQAYFNQGHFEKAAKYWEEARSSIPENEPKYIDTSVRLAAAYQSLGHVNRALRVLEGALPLAENDPERRANVLLQLSGVYFTKNDLSNALTNLNNAQSAAPSQAKSPLLWANILNNKGNILLAQAEKIALVAKQEMAEKKEKLNQVAIHQKKLDKEKEKMKEIGKEIEITDRKFSWQTLELRKKLSEKAFGSEKDLMSKNKRIDRIEWNTRSRERQQDTLKKQAEELDKQTRNNFSQADKNSFFSLCAYKKALKLAEQAGDLVLRAKVSVNIIQHAVQFGKYDALTKELTEETILQQVKKLGAYKQASALINLAKLMRSAFNPSLDEYLLADYIPLSFSIDAKRKRYPKAYQYAYDALVEALQIAKNQGNELTIAYAEFYLAQLYAENNDYEKAIKLTQDGIYHAQGTPILINYHGDRVIRANHFVPKRVQAYIPKISKPSLNKLTAQERKECLKKCAECREKCQGEFHPFMQNCYLPRKCECEGDCLVLPPLLTQNYHPELLFRLERQLGNFFEKQGEIKLAKDAYLEAIEYLQQIREGYHCGSSQMSEIAEEFLTEVADFFLQSAATKKGYNKRELLKAGMQTIELLKETELQNFFQDVCVTKAVKPQPITVQNLPEDTAVFYPIIFEDKNCNHRERDSHCEARLELLLVSHDNIVQKTVQPIYNLKGIAQSFYEKIASKGAKDGRKNKNLLKDIGINMTYDYRPDAQKLYQWLIEPIKNELKGIKTLVIVRPDEFLNTPFAALHNGKNGKDGKFLIEEYALAFTPSLKSTEVKKMSRDNISALLSGLIKCDEQHNKYCKGKRWIPLDGAMEEIDGVGNVLRNMDTSTIHELRKEDFLRSEVESRLDSIPYSIVHFTTHGQFKQNPNDSFLLTYENALTISHLEKILKGIIFQSTPVELLTLSACQSAKGGERGLAGIAIKTGVRSAFATLWLVDDYFTKNFMIDFYTTLFDKEHNLSKAKALKEIQKNSIENGKDPYYWAPFILIGNWL